MTDQVYFIGYRAEQFTGWDGTGSPSYSGVGASSTNETNNLGYINLSASGNVIWKDLDITDTSKPVYITFEALHTINDGNDHTTANLFLTDGSSLLCFSHYKHNGVSYYTVSSGSYTNSGAISSLTTVGSYTGDYERYVIYTHKIFIKLSSTTSGFDTISVVFVEQGTTNEITVYSGSVQSLTSLKSIFSCYYPLNSYTMASYFYYCVVANFDLTGSYIDYTQVSAEATYTGWTGTVSTLTNYPLITNNAANGLYSYNAGDQVTFTSAKSLTTGDGYTTPKCTFIDTTLMSSKDDLGYQAVPIVKNANTSTTYTMGSVATPTTTPTNYQWINYQNPSNLSDWSVSDVNTLEFGLKRSK